MTMTEKLTPFDAAEHLKSDQAIADFMSAAFETNDTAYIAQALGVVARAKGMTQIADQDRVVARTALPVVQYRRQSDASHNVCRDESPRY